MKHALQLRQHQSLSLTPQLQQAIRLLQMSSMELEIELRQMLETNPLLDLTDPADGEDYGDGENYGDDTQAASPDAEEAREPAEIGEESAMAEDGDFADGFDDDGDSDGYGAGHRHDGDEDFQHQQAQPEDLRDHLLWQLNLASLSPRDRTIGIAIIEAIDEDGYLHEDVDSLRRTIHGLSPQTAAPHAGEIEALRHRIQRFDPPGVGSRTLAECLCAQLEVLDHAAPGWRIARDLAATHLETLARNDRARLCKQLGAEPNELDAAIALVRSLDPKPGRQYGASAPEFIVPDAYARRQNGRWTATLSPRCRPRLTINRHYADLIAHARRDDADYLRGQMQEARWLIKSLDTRADTMLKVASAIVRAQSAFLDFGLEAMRPLVLRDIAEQIGMHESTVSRMTTRKYLHTPRGTFEFKYFFSSSVGTIDGGTASAAAIRAMIKKLIDEETPRQPLSDQALAAELNRRGIEVARRTVAKYRESMNIPSSNERSRLG